MEQHHCQCLELLLSKVVDIGEIKGRWWLEFKWSLETPAPMFGLECF